jgi:putative transposase
MVAEYLKGRRPSDICRFYGTPRKTFYHWLDVWRADPDNFVRNVAGGDHTPKHQPHLTNEETTKIIIRLRKKSKYGPKMLRLLLLDRGVTMSISGIAKVLKRTGLVKKQHRTRKKKYKKFSAFMTRPGERVQTDVAYMNKLFGKTHRQYCYQTIDLCTRLSFSLIYPECTPQNTVDFLRRARRFFPFKIETFQFDNGTEFTYDLWPNVKKVHPVQRYLDKAGIRRVFSPVATPRMNGAVERLHRTWRQELERWHKWKKPSQMHQDNQRWLMCYNEKRPHSGIGDLSPIQKLRSFHGYENATLNYSQCYFTV